MTWMKRRKKEVDDQFMRDFDRGLLRGAFVSAFWSVIQVRKKEDGLTLKAIADRLGVDKSAVSRWFASEPNWELNTVADIAGSLDVDVTVEFTDRKTGRRFGPAGEIVAATPTSSVSPYGVAQLRANTTSTNTIRHEAA